MHLPLASNIEPYRTGDRLPRREPFRLGLYADQSVELDRLSDINEVWRTEIRIGAQTAIDPRKPTEHIERIHEATKGMIMRHVYGPIYDELIKVVDDLRNKGTYHGDPAFDRVGKMIDTLGAAFRGYC